METYGLKIEQEITDMDEVIGKYMVNEPKNQRKTKEKL
jgi:hypothetical protein